MVQLRMGAHDDRTALEAVQYIRSNWPWWDRNGGGGRHIVIQTGEHTSKFVVYWTSYVMLSKYVCG